MTWSLDHVLSGCRISTPAHTRYHLLYYWVLAETFAAAAALALRTGNDRYWTWYDTVWAFCDHHFVDHRYGGWYRILDQHNRKLSDEKSPPSKTDYHPLAACYETLEAMRHATA